MHKCRFCLRRPTRGGKILASDFGKTQENRCEDNLFKIKERQRKDVGKFAFVNRSIRDWNFLPAKILSTFKTGTLRNLE